MLEFAPLACLLLLCLATLSAAQVSSNRNSKWLTLSGNAPLVIARGGFSGLFPDSSEIAYNFSILVSLPNVVLWCDVQLTKDGAGICFPDLRLDNASNINRFFTTKSTYLVNGVSLQGWFSVDFNLNDLTDVGLTQGVFSRIEKFDGMFPILTVQHVAKNIRPQGLWLNIQHDSFFREHKLSTRNFVISTSRSVVVNYISSPEVNFLRSISAQFKPSTTKLVFRFLGQDDVEPSTNQTYGSLLENLTFVRSFASGILVPKSYIWPVDGHLYLQPHTSVVFDAHKKGLEVYASEFANDVPFAYNYSYDPVSEYLSFIDNGNFSVDGVLSDFPLTPSEAIDCFSHLDKHTSKKAKPLIISSEGASGDYTGCTDLAYAQAISDGADVIDCPVQMTKDGIPFCLGSINLIDRTTVAQSPFSNLTAIIPELETVNGIFTFDLTWSQIQSLTPVIQSPSSMYLLYRNPKFKNSGKFMTLSEFLAFANNATSISGVLIKIENAAYLAEKQGLNITGAVFAALSEAGYNNQTVTKVMIQSTNSSVLIKFKEYGNYELIYNIDESIRDALSSTILGLKKFANSVVITKTCVFPVEEKFVIGSRPTDVVSKLQAFNFPVYVQLFSNEFVSQAWDFFSDPYVELNTFLNSAGIDGVITDFPGTAAKYRMNRCLGLGDNTPIYMSPVPTGEILPYIPLPLLPPAEAPNPILTDSDVVEPPLPPVAEKVPTPDAFNLSTPAAPMPPPNGQPKLVAPVFSSALPILLAAVSLLWKP